MTSGHTLEWRNEGGQWRAVNSAGNNTEWLIKVWTNATFELRFGQHPYEQELAFGIPSLEAAKSLAQKMADVLNSNARTSDIPATLEWPSEPEGSPHYWLYETHNRWKIWFNAAAPGFFLYRFQGREYVAWEPSLAAAKKLAQTLQDVLEETPAMNREELEGIAHSVMQNPKRQEQTIYIKHPEDKVWLALRFMCDAVFNSLTTESHVNAV